MDWNRYKDSGQNRASKLVARLLSGGVQRQQIIKPVEVLILWCFLRNGPGGFEETFCFGVADSFL